MVRKFNGQISTRSFNRLITYKYPESLISEQFRTIRANIKFLEIDKRKEKTFLITSQGIGEGKTTIAVNLAISVALQKRRVLLIDANFKNPALHLYFRLENLIGLTDILSGKSLLNEAVFQTEIGRLEVLTSGQLNVFSSELIEGSSMMDLIEASLKEYDYIFIDSPPILESSYAKILANKCDGVLMVVKYGKTDTESSLEAKRILEKAKANILGVIINK